VADEHHGHHAVQVVDGLVVDLQQKTREMVQRQMKKQRG
jgi:hypothetical protein